MQVLARQKLAEQGRYKGRVQTFLIANGKVLHTIQAGRKQPKKGQKTYTINEVRYTLNWIT
jgi:hypothetical protein